MKLNLTFFAVRITACCAFFAVKHSYLIKNRIEEIIFAANQPQSLQNRNAVEEVIKELCFEGKTKPSSYRKDITSGSWRTIWTTVTSDNIVGQLYGAPASNILGGESWQVVSKDLSRAENVVLWSRIGVRMAGQALLTPSPNRVGYSLTIKGLEFRWGIDGCPEASGLIGETAVGDGKRLTVLKLDDSTVLRNGVGSLDVLFNDGFFRVTRDAGTDITYVHIKEPVATLAAAANINANAVRPYVRSNPMK